MLPIKSPKVDIVKNEKLRRALVSFRELYRQLEEITNSMITLRCIDMGIDPKSILERLK